MVAIVRCAPKLRELKFDKWNDPKSIIDENVFMKIVDVVSAREIKCRLNVIFSERFVFVPLELQKDNEHMLKITFTQKLPRMNSQ